MPKEVEVLSTEVTEEEIKNGIEDEFGVTYSKDGKKLLKATEGLCDHYMIKEGTKVICNAAFSECEYLTSINIPDSVTSIGYAAFYECESLTSINIPDSVIKMEGNPFAGCHSLTSINIPDSVTSIGYSAFYGCENLNPQIKDDIIKHFGEEVF